MNNICKYYIEEIINFNKLLNDSDFSGKLRFLAFRLDFNEFYKNHEDKKILAKIDSDCNYRLNNHLILNNHSFNNDSHLPKTTNAKSTYFKENLNPISIHDE